MISDPTGDADVDLVVQYEYAPTGSKADEFVLGGRVEGWLTDRLRLGVTGTSDKTGFADQTAAGVDLRYRLGDRSHLHLEYAESDGPGNGARQSLDAGLIFDSTGPVTGSGQAVRLETFLDFEDFSLERPGTFSAYFEDRTAGFSTLDYNVASDDRLFGFTLNTELSGRLDISASYDGFKSDDGRIERETYLGLDYALSTTKSLAVGIERLERDGQSENGARTDAALRYTTLLAQDREVYVFGQATLESSGLPDNNRVGVGGTYRFSDAWLAEGELSGGDLGAAARLKFSHAPDENQSSYFGYELDPARTFNGFGNLATTAERSHYVIGGRNQVNERVAVFGENSYDLFGRQQSLTSTYGVEYATSDFLTYSIGVEFGELEDPDTDNFERTGISLGVNYDNDGDLVANALLEWRQDDGDTVGSLRDSETLALSFALRHKIDETRRLLFSLQAVSTSNNRSTELDGDYVDAVFGYALRPVSNDRLNVLFQYRYLLDEYGQRIDGVDALGSQQRSHIFSLDTSYDLNNYWTIGGKLGARLSESRNNEADAYSGNDAMLWLVDARYHLTHQWDLLAEMRNFRSFEADTDEFGFLVAAYRHVGNNWKVGVGYNFTSFSEDLADLTLDDKGIFLNVVAKF